MSEITTENKFPEGNDSWTDKPTNIILPLIIICPKAREAILFDGGNLFYYACTIKLLSKQWQNTIACS